MTPLEELIARPIRLTGPVRLRAATTIRTADTAEPLNCSQILRGGGASVFRFAWILGVVLAGMSSVTSAMPAEPVLLADPTAPLEQTWTHQRFRHATDYERVTLDGVAAIRAIARDSASGLYRDVDYRLADHPWLEWTWRVDKLQRTADIRVKDREDFAAAIFLIFGHPSMLNPDVPTLAYVWTSDLLPEGAVVDSPHHPNLLRDIVVRSGVSRLGQWVHERRNVAEDFRRAFGQEPPDTVGVLALFTDNDQTGEPVVSYYGAITGGSE